MIESSAGNEILDWNANNQLSAVDERQVHLSRGYLRSYPARWFPGISTHWLPLLHTTECELKINEVVPAVNSSINMYENRQLMGSWLLDDDRVVLYCHRSSADFILKQLIPGSTKFVKDAMLNYLSRRIAISLLNSWSGRDSSQFVFDSEFQDENYLSYAWINMKLTLQNEKINLSFGLSKRMAEKLDGMWRRQINQTPCFLSAQQQSKRLNVQAELTRLSVAPHSLPGFLKAGNIIDLEKSVGTEVMLIVSNEAWLSGKLCHCDDKFTIESLGVKPNVLFVAEGLIPLSVEFGSFDIDPLTASELEQTGAMIKTDWNIDNIVNLSIRGDRVGRGKLAVYQGRYAVQVM